MTAIAKKEYEALAGFRFALREFLQFSEEAAAAAGLTPRQHQALLAMLAFPGREAATIGELAIQLQIRPNSAVGLVDRLEAQGLVTRRSDGTDRRQVYVSLKPKGRRLLEKLSAAHKAELERLGPRLREVLSALEL
ncbi:MAG: MarR family transcriptional regulator [Anaerolineales bacterium]